MVIRMYCHTWVAPFGNLRVEGYLLLTAAYRSLSRPSSAPSAKASALCSSSLNLKLVFLVIFFVATPCSLAHVLKYIRFDSQVALLEYAKKYFVCL